MKQLGDKRPLVPKLLSAQTAAVRNGDAASELPALSKDKQTASIQQNVSRPPLASYNGKVAPAQPTLPESDAPPARQAAPLPPKPSTGVRGKLHAFKDGQEIHNMMKMLTSEIDVLVEDEGKPKRGRGRGKAAKEDDNDIGLKEKLLKSWEGKSYLERLDVMMGSQCGQEQAEKEEPVYKPIDFAAFKADSQELDEVQMDSTSCPAPSSNTTTHCAQQDPAQQPVTAAPAAGQVPASTADAAHVQPGRQKHSARQTSNRIAAAAAAAAAKPDEAAHATSAAATAALPKGRAGSRTGVKRCAGDEEGGTSQAPPPSNKRRLAPAAPAPAAASASTSAAPKTGSTPADKARAVTRLGSDSAAKHPAARGSAAAGSSAQVKARKPVLPGVGEAQADGVNEPAGTGVDSAQTRPAEVSVMAECKGGAGPAAAAAAGQVSSTTRRGAAAAKQICTSRRKVVTVPDDDYAEEQHNTATVPPSDVQEAAVLAAPAKAAGRGAGKKGGRALKASPTSPAANQDMQSLDAQPPDLGPLQAALDASNTTCQELRLQLNSQQAENKKLQKEMDGLRKQLTAQGGDAAAEAQSLKADLVSLQAKYDKAIQQLQAAEEGRLAALEHLTKPFA